jgi:hypothetical protein
MNKEETDGYLRALELQLQSIENSFGELDRQGKMNDKAYEIFRKVRINLINLSQTLTEVRGWNISQD